MKTVLKNLVNDFYTNEQKLQVEELKKEYVSGTHMLNYKILSLALGDKFTEMPKDDWFEYYELDKNEKEFFDFWVSEVDLVIAGILLGLTNELGEDIKRNYEDNIVLDPADYEFDYLVGKVKEYLSKKEEINNG